MKKILSFLAVAALVVSCSKMDEAQPSSYTLTGYSEADTRTAFGAPDANSIPFLWSAGDKIWVGSQQSAAISEGGSRATFTLATEPEQGAAVYYNMTGSGATAVVPTSQSVANTLGQNGDFGYATVDNGSFALSHATSYLWFEVTGMPSGATLKSIRLHADNAIVAGSAAWNGSSFGAASNGRSIIDLAINKTSFSGADVVMVVLPTSLPATTKVSYELCVGGETKFYEKTLAAKTLTAGKTYKISVNLSTVSLTPYVLRTLTFEDNHALFTPYYIRDASVSVNEWSDLIDSKMYGGDVLYSVSGSYSWNDKGNTNLAHSFSGQYWGGGHAISNYSNESYSDDDFDDWITNFYTEQELTDSFGYTYGGGDSQGVWYGLQLLNTVGGYNGSSNFAVHNGYSDFFNSHIYDASLEGFEFSDGVARVIDHIYVTSINYNLHSLAYGDGFNAAATDDTYFKIVVYGYDAGGNSVGEPLKFTLWENNEGVTDWQKWDLSSLGAVVKIAFNIEASEDQSGDYGLNCPAYFAYDNVAVQWK